MHSTRAVSLEKTEVHLEYRLTLIKHWGLTWHWLANGFPPSEFPVTAFSVCGKIPRTQQKSQKWRRFVEKSFIFKICPNILVSPPLLDSNSARNNHTSIQLNRGWPWERDFAPQCPPCKPHGHEKLPSLMGQEWTLSEVNLNHVRYRRTRRSHYEGKGQLLIVNVRWQTLCPGGRKSSNKVRTRLKYIQSTSQGEFSEVHNPHPQIQNRKMQNCAVDQTSPLEVKLGKFWCEPVQAVRAASLWFYGMVW